MEVNEIKKDGKDNKTHGNLLNHILIFLLSIVVVETQFYILIFYLLVLLLAKRCNLLVSLK